MIAQSEGYQNHPFTEKKNKKIQKVTINVLHVQSLHDSTTPVKYTGNSKE